MSAHSATHLGSGGTPTRVLWGAPISKNVLVGRSKQAPVSTSRFTSLAPLIFHFCIGEHTPCRKANSARRAVPMVRPKSSRWL